MNSLATFFSEQSFMPHGHCYLWTPALVWVQFLSNLLIGLAYVAISAVLLLFVTRTGKLPFKWVYASFGVFIVSCGLTHFMDVLVIWHPHYWIDGAMRVVTALASVGTALMMPRLLPQALALVKGAQLVRERGMALEAAVSDLETLYKKTLELDQLKTSFFANVSHELRTPLTLILAPVEQLIRRDRWNDDERRDLELVARNARLLLGHVNNLLDIAKLDAQKLEARLVAVDFAAIVRETAAHFEAVARDRKLTLLVDTPETLPAEIDPEKVERVLLNLLSNAFKHTPEGGQIRVTLMRRSSGVDARPGPSVLLSVADSGAGVAKDEREIIFERFRQSRDETTRPVGGTGLGLSLVREFVTLHGGKVGVRDAEGGGALFEVVLPLRTPSERDLESVRPRAELATRILLDELRVAEPLPELTAEPAPDVPLVLVVDDNEDMRTLLAHTLGARYRLAQARDGAEGLERALLLEPDLIVSDLMMPRMSGEELVSAARSSKALKETPILLLTAKIDEEARTHALALGAQDYVLKPFSPDELLARVHNLLALKRTRDLLQQEVEGPQADVELLSRQVVAQKHELASALIAAREARGHAEQASRAKSDFLSLVSHELRTPLTSIQLQLERLRRGVAGVVTPEQTQVMEKIARSAARLLDLLDSLLEFSRIESGRLEVSRSAVDLGSVAREVIDELRPRADQKGLALGLSMEAEPMIVQTDARLLRLIVANLVDNAIKYTEQGSVELRIASTTGGSVTLQVVDTGVGIDPAEQARIFEPFLQLEQVRHKREPGVGLGLALVRSIAQALEAEVAVESEPGRGSAFSLRLSAA